MDIKTYNDASYAISTIADNNKRLEAEAELQLIMCRRYRTLEYATRVELLQVLHTYNVLDVYIWLQDVD